MGNHILGPVLHTKADLIPQAYLRTLIVFWTGFFNLPKLILENIMPPGMWFSAGVAIRTM